MLGKQKNVLLAGTFGNALEWYDFTIYAFLVPIFAPIFFPSQDPLISLLSTFGVFAVGFLVRPVGAVLFGYISDHKGRKQTLILSMLLMSGPTFCMALLPTYQHVGALAPLLLTLLRIAQGLAVSGELTTATVFLVEHADADRRGIAGSLAMSGALIGIVLSSLVASILTASISTSALSTWGWRIPFLLGGLLGIVGLIIRLKSVEPEVYEHQINRAHVSVMNHIKSLEPKIVLTGIFLTSIMAIANYFLIAYFNVFLSETQKLPLSSVASINSIAIGAQLILSICMGRISDYIGRKRVLGAGIIGIMLLVLPIFWLLNQHNIQLALYGEILFAIAAAAISGLIPTTLAEMFDTYHRTLGISVCYNIALAIFGGTVPLVAILLITLTKNNYAPAGYIMVCAVISYFCLTKIKETYQKKLA